MRSLLALTLLCTAGSASGQSMNIDFGDGFGGPGEAYGAVGSPGVWNAPAAIPDSAQTLVGLDRAPLAATLTITSGGIGLQQEDSGALGDHQALVDDYLFSVGPPIFLHFAGLDPGVYDVITYAFFDAEFQINEVTLNGDGATTQTLSGFWPGGPVEGITHVVHRNVAINGSLMIEIDNNFDPLVNGVQLVRVVPGPAAGLLLLALPLGVRGVGDGDEDVHLMSHHLHTAIVACVLSAGCERDERSLAEAQSLLGQSQAEVLTVMGEPAEEAYLDTVALDPAEHTPEEMAAWYAAMPQLGLEYGEITIWLNADDVVIEVIPTGQSPRSPG